MNQNASRLADLGIYLVTDRELCGDRGVVETVRLAVAGGATCVQLRDKHAGFEEHLDQLAALAEAIDGRALLLVNDRLDVAIEARRRGIRFDGVHLGQGDDAVMRARAELGSGMIVGLSADTAAHLAALEAMPPGTVDYLGVGVIRPTSTKPDHPAALGIDGFARFAASTELPCVAIGGIRLGDTAPLRLAGAAGVAVVSAICAATEPVQAARDFADEWNGAIQ